MRLEFSIAARDDLRDIVRWGVRSWGVVAARQYIDALRADVDRLRDFPQLGRLDEDLFPGARAILTGSHRVFYRIDGERVQIVRILHQRASTSIISEP